MKRARLVLLLSVVVATVSAGTVFRARRHLAHPAVAAIRAPNGVRVRVQVLNGTKMRGLARRATLVLRDHGFDVVEMGTSGVGSDSTVVYDYTGHPDWADRVAKIFSPARVVSRPDSSRDLDVAVVLGTTWRAPSQPFYP
jgi:hypothetical protein